MKHEQFESLVSFEGCKTNNGLQSPKYGLRVL